ncbi:MAG: T9SS type A sorting domain-containing protein [Bacteroidales bacterium]|nr:T9SS type A sorting domain-containing protein [Bacteroidales bacterium]
MENLIKTKKLSMLCMALFLVMGTSMTAKAQTAITTEATTTPIVRWTFRDIATAGFGPSPFAPTAHDFNMTVGGFVRHWTPSGGTPALHAWGGNNFAITATTIDAAITANNFATFTLTANEEHALWITEIGNYNIRRSAGGPTTGQWQFQVGTDAFVDIGAPITWGTVVTVEGNTQEVIDLSGFTELQNVAAGTTVTFRLVVWGATQAAGTFYFSDAATSAANRPGLIIYGKVVSTALVATPVLSHATGNMFEPTNVTITAETGADIYFTKDVNAPRWEFTPYTSDILISETTTLRAIAVIGSDTSAMAIATYTLPIDVDNIEEFLAESATAGAGTMFRITGDLTFVWRPEAGQGTATLRNNIFVKDETGGLLVFDNVIPFSFTENYEPGDVITSGLVGTRDVNSGQVRLVTTRHQPALSTAGTPSTLSIEPVEITMEDLLADIDNMNARLVRLRGVDFTTSHTFAPNTASNATIKQGGVDTLVVRSHFHGIGLAVSAATSYDITGFVWRDVSGMPLTTTHQVVLRSTGDINENANPYLSFETNAMAFGNQDVNTTSAVQTVVVTGKHLDANIIVGSLEGANPNYFDAEWAEGYDHRTGGTINITFTPLTAGAKRAVLRITSGELTDSIVLTGTGADPATSICPREELENSVVFFPNPVVDMLHVQTEQTISMVSIYSLKGQLVVQQHGNVNSVDVSAPPRGTYVVRIIFDNGAILSRVIVK